MCYIVVPYHLDITVGIPTGNFYPPGIGNTIESVPSFSPEKDGIHVHLNDGHWGYKGMTTANRGRGADCLRNG